MGSLRSPVGPLPSSIYWRRRAVAAVLIALLAALVVWAVTSGGGGGKNDDGKSGGSAPAPSITPGPSGSGPVVGQPPGGREESEENGGGSGSGPGSGTGSAGGDGSTGTGGSGGTAAGGTGGAGAGGTGGSGTGPQVPAGSPLPDCAASALQLSVRTKNSYGPDDKPVFQLVAENTSAADCKADLGPKTAVLTVTEAGEDDEQVWSSKDCPRAGAVFLRVPAGATVVHTVEWDRVKSTPGCGTPPPGKAAPGTYLLEAKAPGETVQRASFVLAKD